jgi:hypothetical protein
MAPPAARSLDTLPWSVDVAGPSACVEGAWFPAVEARFWSQDHPGWPDESDGVVFSMLVPCENGTDVAVCLSAHPHHTLPVWTRIAEVYVPDPTALVTPIPAHPALLADHECVRATASVTLIDEVPCRDCDRCCVDGVPAGELFADTDMLSFQVRRFAQLDASLYAPAALVDPRP